MPASLAAIRAGIGNRLDTISGLRVVDYIPDTAPVPCVFISGPESCRAMAFGETKHDWRLKVRFLVSRADDRGGQKQLDAFINTGTTSVKDAIATDKTLGGVVDFCMIIDNCTNYGIYDHNGIKYWGYEALLRVVG